jgi:CubicO group peptidase (beta-lactamase class C family)
MQQSEDLEACARAQMERWTVPGMAIGVLRGGETETYALGVASLETEFPVRTDTLFQIGSISKVFVATLIMRLVEQGTVDLDAPVATYLPELQLADQQAQQTITVWHTLTHTSGIYGDCFDDFGWGDDALAKFVANFHTLRQVTAPGELWAYCNSGFGLAGLVIERVLDKPFEAAMREHIFEPLGMEHSFYFAHEAIAYPAAVGHTQKEPFGDEHEIARQYPLPRSSNPAGGIISTVADLLTFAAFHMGDRTVNDPPVLTRPSIVAMQQEQIKAGNLADAWGIGWDINMVDGVKTIGHGGATNGFNARLTLVPEQHFAIAILTNSGRGAAAYRRIVDWALQHYCGLHPDEPTPIRVPNEVLARYAGEYQQPLAHISVAVEDGGLRIEQTTISPLTDKHYTLPPLHASPIGERKFMVDSEGQTEGTRFDFIGGDEAGPRFVRMGGRLADRV